MINRDDAEIFIGKPYGTNNPEHLLDKNYATVSSTRATGNYMFTKPYFRVEIGEIKKLYGVVLIPRDSGFYLKKRI